jgi:hypothetical protein
MDADKSPIKRKADPLEDSPSKKQKLDPEDEDNPLRKKRALLIEELTQDYSSVMQKNQDQLMSVDVVMDVENQRLYIQLVLKEPKLFLFLNLPNSWRQYPIYVC